MSTELTTKSFRKGRKAGTKDREDPNHNRLLPRRATDNPSSDLEYLRGYLVGYGILSQDDLGNYIINNPQQ